MTSLSHFQQKLQWALWLAGIRIAYCTTRTLVRLTNYANIEIPTALIWITTVTSHRCVVQSNIVRMTAERFLVCLWTSLHLWISSYQSQWWQKQNWRHFVPFFKPQFIWSSLFFSHARVLVERRYCKHCELIISTSSKVKHASWSNISSACIWLGSASSGVTINTAHHIFFSGNL